ncbi:hypothetical protein D049_0647A, partial [Vibrio parahaemolyticus VPTS-2010]
MNDVHRT